MTLLELVDPILERVCVLNRAGGYSAASSSRLSIHEVRSEFVRLLDAARDKAMKDPVLSGEYAKIEENLVVFVDNILARSDLPFSAEWHEHRLAHSYLTQPILNGEERFFDAVRHALDDRSANVRDRLLFYYVCLGLGFAERGPLDEDDRRKLQETLAGRLHDTIQFDLSIRICPEAYKHVDERDLTRTLRTPLRWTVVAAAAALVATIGYTWMSVVSRNQDLDSALANLQILTSAFGGSEALTSEAEGGSPDAGAPVGSAAATTGVQSGREVQQR